MKSNCLCGYAIKNKESRSGMGGFLLVYEVLVCINETEQKKNKIIGECMVRRSKRGFVKKDEVLKKLAVGRNGALQVITESKINSGEYKKASGVTHAIDDLAEELTGEREYFWLKGHSTNDVAGS